jgi:hypothetical protein
MCVAVVDMKKEILRNFINTILIDVWITITGYGILTSDDVSQNKASPWGRIICPCSEFFPKTDERSPNLFTSGCKSFFLWQEPDLRARSRGARAAGTASARYAYSTKIDQGVNNGKIFVKSKTVSYNYTVRDVFQNNFILTCWQIVSGPVLISFIKIKEQGFWR